MDHRVFRELAAGAALEDLEPAESTELSAHLAICAPCRREAGRLADVAGLVALAAPPRRPPATMKRSVLVAVAAADRAELPAAPTRLWPVPDPSAQPIQVTASAAARPPVVRWRAAAVLGLAATIVLGVATGALLVQNRSLDGSLAAPAAERDAAVRQLAADTAAMGVVLAPDHATAVLHPESLAPAAVAYVFYRPGEKDAWLMATGMPATPVGSVYELWAADATGVHPGPTFTCTGSGPCLASLGMDLAGKTAAMVTLEPAGGAVSQPGPQVVFGQL
jgi:hypothetical protein